MNRSIKERLLSGGAWAFVGKLVMMLAGLAINGLLTRLLTPEDMGAYFLTLSLVSMAAVVAQFGLTQAIIRFVAESMATDRPGRAKQYVAMVLRVVAFGCLIVVCFLVFGMGQWIARVLFNSEVMSHVMGLAAVWVVIVAFQQLISEIYRGFHDIRLATVLGGLTTSVFSMTLFMILWLLQGESELGQIIILTLVAGVSSVLISSVILWNKLSKHSSVTLLEDKVSFSEVIHISWPLWITNMTLFALVQVDLWIMGLFRTPEEVAIYGTAARMVALVAMPLMIVNAVVPPLIAEMYAQKKIKELEKTLRTVATLAGLAALVAFGLFAFWADTILGLFFGTYYQTGGVVLVVLGIGQLANVWSGSCGQVLMLTGYQQIMMLITIFSGFITAVFSLWLVIPFGGVGVASAAALGILLQNLLMLFCVKNKVGVWTHANPLLIKHLGSIL